MRVRARVRARVRCAKRETTDCDALNMVESYVVQTAKWTKMRERTSCYCVVTC